MAVKDYPLINTRATVDMETSYPTGNTQAMTLALHGEIPGKTLRVRFGPFSPDCGVRHRLLLVSHYLDMWNTKSTVISLRENSHALRLTSELVDLRAAKPNPCVLRTPC